MVEPLPPMSAAIAEHVMEQLVSGFNDGQRLCSDNTFLREPKSAYTFTYHGRTFTVSFQEGGGDDD